MTLETQSVALVVNIGTQDVKLWRDGGQLSLERPAQQALLAAYRAGQCRFVARSETPDAEERPLPPLLVSARGQREGTGKPDADAAPKPKAFYDSDGRLLLEAAKVADIVDGLRAAQSMHPVHAIAVVYTDRPDRRSEPSAFGPMLLDYLGETLAVPPARRHLINAIQDGEAEPKDGLEPVRAAVANWVDGGVREFATLCPHDCTPVLLNTGGMDQVKDLLRGALALRFAESFRDLSTQAKMLDAPGFVARRLSPSTPSFSRAEALQARALALSLVRRGDVTAAWAAVSRYDQSPEQRPWTRPLREVARYLNAAVEGPHDPEDTLIPLDMRIDSHVDRREQYRRATLQAAVRAEAALQGARAEDRRVVDALSAVCGLFDAALATIVLLTQAAHPEHLGTAVIKDELLTRRKHWDPGVAGSVGAKLRSKGIELPTTALSALDHVLSTQVIDGLTLRELRNCAAHRALSIEQVLAINDGAVATRLWRPAGRHAFGAQALAPAGDGLAGLIADVLASPGIEVTDMAERYRRIMEGLIQALLA